MSEKEPQNAVNHEEKVELVQEKAELDEKKVELPEKVDQSEESEAKHDIADESAIADSSVNAEKSDANAGDDEDSDSESDESLPPGLLERPVEILEAKRERKKIKRFTYDDDKTSPAAEKKKTIEIPKGSGIRLGEHPRVEYQLQRNSAEDLKIIHRFFFGVQGVNLSCKKNLRGFCGFVMEKDSPEFEKKEEFIGRFTVDNLKWAMTVCDVPVKGNKDDLIDTFMEWCLCPKPQDKPLPEKRKKKDPAQKKKKKKVKRTSKAVENGNATSDGATPVKKRKKKDDSVPKKKKTPAKSPAKKSTTNKKAKIKITTPKSKAKVESSMEEDTSDDEPLMQKRKSPPTNVEIRKFIENFLKDADLEVLTMKVVFQQVYEQYPEFDLSDRKSFIKEAVKKIIS